MKNDTSNNTIIACIFVDTGTYRHIDRFLLAPLFWLSDIKE
jgi:hypothetical protein